MTRAAIGVDVGGTKIAGAVVDTGGELWCEEVVATPRDDSDHGDGCGEILALVDRLMVGAAACGLAVERVGVGVPEYVTPQGRINRALIVPSLQALPAATASGIPIMVGSDVRCAARAESRFGHGRGLPSFVFVIIGTGISSTLVIDGRLWPGHRGEAIALGELPADPALALRPASPMTVEEQASGRAIGEALEAAASSGRPPQHSISHQASIVGQAGEILAAALDIAVHLLDPAAVVVGGGLGASDGPFFDSMTRRYSKLVSDRADPPPLLQARLGNRAGVIGAGLLALEDD